jgi:hypothetical protein
MNFLKMKKVANYLFLIFILLLISGCQGTSGASTGVVAAQGQGCLYFISRETANEGIVRACMGTPPEPILAAERIQEYALATKTGTIATIKKADSGQNEIWIQHPGKKSSEFLLSCESDRCESLAIKPDGLFIYYSRIGKITGVYQVDVKTGSDIRITSAYADWIDISPNGAYARVHEPETGLLRILSLENIEVILSFPGDTDLIGTWNPDGTRFLMGERNVEGQLLISRYAEISVPEQARIELFTLPMGLEYFRPAYFTADSFFVVARSGVRNNSRVISIIDNNGVVQNSVTEPTEYDHSSIQWNEDSQLLAYQRYDISRSDSVPEIVVWDQKNGTSLIIAENAVQPRWWD